MIVDRGVRCFHDKHLTEKIVIEINIAEISPPGNEKKRQEGDESV